MVRLWWNYDGICVTEDFDGSVDQIQFIFNLKGRPHLLNGFDIIVTLDDTQENDPDLFLVGCSERVIDRWTFMVSEQLGLARAGQMINDAPLNEHELRLVMQDLLNRRVPEPVRIDLRLCRIEDGIKLIAASRHWEISNEWRTILRCQNPNTRDPFVFTTRVTALPFLRQLRITTQPLPHCGSLQQLPPVLLLDEDPVWSPLLNYCGLELLLRLSVCSKEMRRRVLNKYHLSMTEGPLLMGRWLEHHVFYRDQQLGSSPFLLEGLPVFGSERFGFLFGLLNCTNIVFDFSCETDSIKVYKFPMLLEALESHITLFTWREPEAFESLEPIWSNFKRLQDRGAPVDCGPGHWLRVQCVSSSCKVQVQPLSDIEVPSAILAGLDVFAGTHKVAS